MGLIERLRDLRPQGPLGIAEAERQMTLFLEKYQGLRANVLDWYQTSFNEGDAELAELNVEIDDARLGIRNTNSFMMRLPAARRTIVFLPWGLTHRTPIWALVQIYPLNALFKEHWIGLMVPPDLSLMESDWVDLGNEYSFDGLGSREHKGFFQPLLDSVMSGFIDNETRNDGK